MRTPFNKKIRYRRSRRTHSALDPANGISNEFYPDPLGKRVFFTDNFYTRHTHAKELQRIIDNEVRLIETVTFTNVDRTNRKHLSEAISILRDAPRGSWCLVRAYDIIPDL